jgi:hypothetical protein
VRGGLHPRPQIVAQTLQNGVQVVLVVPALQQPREKTGFVVRRSITKELEQRVCQQRIVAFPKPAGEPLLLGRNFSL